MAFDDACEADKALQSYADDLFIKYNPVITHINPINSDGVSGSPRIKNPNRTPLIGTQLRKSPAFAGPIR